MEALYESVHTWITNLIGGHPVAAGLVALFVFVIRPMLIAYLKDAYPKSTPPTGKQLLALAEVQAILRMPLTTLAEQEAAVDALVRVISPPVVRPPVVSGVLAALGIITNWYRWIFQKIGITPPTEDVVGSSPDIPLPDKPLPRSSTEPKP